jgi:hypothetical protein
VRLSVPRGTLRPKPLQGRGGSTPGAVDGRAATRASHVAGLRRQDKLDGFKTGLLFGPIGVAMLTFKKERIPDIEVACPNCGTRQEVDGALQWFECWKCEARSDVLR